jgi:hypothetical protein
VVMVVQARADGMARYPVKLDHVTRIGRDDAGIAWMDTLSNVEYESEMRPLTARERGLAPKPRCDCHLYERQVCNVCQDVTGAEIDHKQKRKRGPAPKGSKRK